MNQAASVPGRGPTVSVILPSRNRGDLLGRALRSVRAQTFRDFEVIVVDDGSEDGTAAVVSEFPEARYTKLDHPRGVSAARNVALRMARGELVAFLDSDDEWLPTKLERQVDLLADSSPEVAVVYSGFFGFDDASQTWTRPEASDYTGDILPNLLRGECPHAASLFMVRRDAIERVGGFDEDLVGFTDTDLWIRLAHEYHFGAVPDRLAVIHSHEGRMSYATDTRQAALDEFMRKWGPAMVEESGYETVSQIRSAYEAEIHANRVLRAVREGNRTEGFSDFVAHLRLSGGRQPTRSAGLLVALLFGASAYDRMRDLFKRRIVSRGERGPSMKPTGY